MNLLKNFAKINDGYYTEESIKEVYSTLGKMIYQPKRARFTISGTKFSVNLNEVGGAIPTAEPYRITLHLHNPFGNSLELYPASIWEKALQRVFPSNKKIIKNNYVLKSDCKLIAKLAEKDSIFRKLKGQKVYIRIDKENTSKIILTPAMGIEDETQFEIFISILKSLEEKIKNLNDWRNH